MNIKIIKALIIASVLVIILMFYLIFSSIDLSTTTEKADRFCKENDMQLKGFSSNGDAECVRIIDNKIVEIKKIVYVKWISDWRELPLLTARIR